MDGWKTIFFLEGSFSGAMLNFGSVSFWSLFVGFFLVPSTKKVRTCQRGNISVTYDILSEKKYLKWWTNFPCFLGEVGNPDLSRRSIFPLENPGVFSPTICANASVFKSPPAVNSSIMYQYLYMYIIYNDYLYMCIILYLYILYLFYRPHATHVASSMGHANLKKFRFAADFFRMLSHERGTSGGVVFPWIGSSSAAPWSKWCRKMPWYCAQNPMGTGNIYLHLP